MTRNNIGATASSREASQNEVASHALPTHTAQPLNESTSGYTIGPYLLPAIGLVMAGAPLGGTFIAFLTLTFASRILGSAINRATTTQNNNSSSSLTRWPVFFNRTSEYQESKNHNTDNRLTNRR